MAVRGLSPGATYTESPGRRSWPYAACVKAFRSLQATTKRTPEMCGIAGIFYYGEPDCPIDRNLLVRMTRTLAHRGPDDEGFHVDGCLGLGHRRLSIVDLSSTGAQPMPNEDRSCWITYNGEFYNHASFRSRLAAKGHRFRGTSDTETLVHLLEEEGPDCLTEVMGILGFAFWEAKRQRLTLARDHLGVKQVYYHDNGRRIVFASEIKALLVCPDVPREPDPEAINQYLHFHTALFDRTLFKSVRQLCPGQFLQITRYGAHLRQYWSVNDFQPRGGGPEENVRQLRDQLSSVVGEQLMSDVPVGSFFSGGIDSSAIAAYAARNGIRPLCFGVHFSDQGVPDERPYQEAAAKALGLSLELTTVDGSRFPDEMMQLMYYQDEPVSRYVRVNWQGREGASSYDVIRTTSEEFPPAGICTGCAVALGTTDVTVNDQGGALSAYTLTTEGEARRMLRLNNRDYTLPSIEFDAPVRISGTVGAQNLPVPVEQGDLSTPDTAAVQTAITSACSAGVKAVTLNNNRITGDLSFAACSGKYLELQIENGLSLGATLNIPSNVRINGRGKVGSQFQADGSANISCDTSLNPCLKVSGHSSINNLYVHGSNFAQVLIDRTSLVLLSNVQAVATVGVATSIPIVNNGSYWIWLDHCVLYSRLGAYPASLRITNNDARHNYAYLVRITRSILAFHGVQVDSQVPANFMGRDSMDDVTYESAANALLNVDATNAPVQNITLSKIEIADTPATTLRSSIDGAVATIPVGSIASFDVFPALFQIESERVSCTGAFSSNLTGCTRGYDGTTAASHLGSINVSLYLPVVHVVAHGERINNLIVKDSPGLGGGPLADAAVASSVFEGGVGYAWDAATRLEKGQKSFVQIASGMVDAQLPTVARAMVPQNLPFTTAKVVQDFTAVKPAENMAIITGVTAPDGSTTAAKFVCTASSSKSLGSISTVRVGDWFIAGVWMRPESTDGPAESNGALTHIAHGGAGTFDNGRRTLALSGLATQRITGGWLPVVIAGKVATTAGGDYISFGVGCQSTTPTSYWMPWLMRVPAGTLPDADVINLSRSLFTLPGNTSSSGGQITILPHQSYCIGDTCISRTSTGVLSIPSAPTWRKYSLVSIANGKNGCTNANGCWQLNGILRANRSAATQQNIVLFDVPAGGMISGIRAKTDTACTGATTAKITSFFDRSGYTFVDLLTFDLSVINNTILSPVLTNVGLGGNSASNFQMQIRTTGKNVDQLASGCAVDVWVLWAEVT